MAPEEFDELSEESGKEDDNDMVDEAREGHRT